MSEGLRGEGFTIIPNDLCEYLPTLSDAAVRVMIALCSRAKNDNNKAWPSKRRMAKDIGRCSSTVLKGIRDYDNERNQ